LITNSGPSVRSHGVTGIDPATGLAPVRHHGDVNHYDLAVIGTGSGNSIVDERFEDWRVAILEENVFGGTCLNVGCIPTKMFVYPADLARSARHAPDLGVLTTYGGARWPQIRDRIFSRIDPIAARGKAYREGLSHVDVFDQHTTFVDDHTLDTGTGQQITADQIVIAAGGRVHLPEIPGLDEVDFHTSDTVMRLDDLPRRMAIVGGGYVAAEFAHIFSALGTEVTQVHRGPVLLREQDEDVSRTFTELASGQWTVLLDTTTTRVERRGEATVLTLSDGSELETDVLLLATGRVPNGDRLGLEHTSVKNADGQVVVDEYQRTSVDGIWALGDISSDHQLKHVANLEGRTVQHNLLHPDDLVASDHRFVPSAVFTSPQIASVGLTSQAAREQGIEHVAVTYDYAGVAYGWAMEDVPDDHFVKLVGDPQGERILGAHIIGPHASMLLQPLVQGMSLGSSPHEMARGQYWIHPSLAEVVENALLKMVTR
jgi:mycothione reductase